ncbi:hypothetical protein ABPG72_010584 [Tetrahymena utriculariae]
MYQPIFETKQKKSCIQVYISWKSYINLLISIAALAFGAYEGIKKKIYGLNLTSTGIKVFISLIFSFVIVAFVFLDMTDSHIVDIKDSNCVGKNYIFRYTQQAYNQASKFLYSEKCPCKISNQDIQEYLNVDSYEDGATRIQDYENYKDYFDSDAIKQLNWAQSLEQTFDCTGMCNKPKNIYFFSDINRGFPDTDTCKVNFQELVSSYGRLAFFVGFVVGSYLLLNAILAFCLCCRKKRQGATIIYERFTFY